MGAIDGRIPALNPELHGNGPVVCDGQNIEQLLEIRAMIFVVAMCNSKPDTTTQTPFLLSRFVIAMKRDGGRIIVKLAEFDLELTDGMCHDSESQGTNIGIE